MENSKQNQSKDNKTSTNSGSSQSEPADKPTDQNSNATSAGSNTSAPPKFNTKHKERQINPPKETRNSNINLDEPASEPSSPNTTTIPSSQSSNLKNALSETSEDQGNQSGGLKPGSIQHTTESNTASQGSSVNEEPTGQSGTPQGPGNTTQQGDSNGSGDGSGKKPSKSRKKQVLVGALVLVVVIFGFGSYVAYAQYVAPRQAPASYVQRLSEANSGDYELNLVSDSEEANFDIDSKGEFSRGNGNFEDFKLSSALGIGMGQGFMSINISLDLLYMDNMLYVKAEDIESMPMVGSLLKSDKWYSLDLAKKDTESTTEAISSGESCTEEDKQALIDYMENDVSDAITVTNPKRHDWFGEDRDGERVKHYSGEIPGAVFTKITRDMAEVTSEECVSEDEVKEAKDEEEGFDITYDLYVGGDHDELVMRWLEDGEEVARINSKTSNYDKEVDLTAPEDSKPLDEALQGGFDMTNTSEGAETDFEFEGGFDSAPTNQSGSDVEFNTR